jgi:hypothetical protein
MGRWTVNLFPTVLNCAEIITQIRFVAGLLARQRHATAPIVTGSAKAGAAIAHDDGRQGQGGFVFL